MAFLLFEERNMEVSQVILLKISILLFFCNFGTIFCQLILPWGLKHRNLLTGVDWRNCVGAQGARADVNVTKVSDEFGCQQGEHNKCYPECFSARLATIFLPAGSGVTGSHTTSPPCWVLGRRILCEECDGEHTIQPLLPHQEHHSSSLAFTGLTGLTV